MMTESQRAVNVVDDFRLGEKRLKLFRGTTGEVGRDAMVSKVKETEVGGSGEEEVVLGIKQRDERRGRWCWWRWQ